MHLAPREMDHLALHQVGALAQKRLARGLRLNYPEAVGLIATVVLEFIRDGKSVAELMDLGRQLLGRRQVMAGVPEMIHDVQVEGTFPDGTKLVTVHHPIAADNGNLHLALYGSFFPIPELSVFGESDGDEPGAMAIADGDIELNAGRPETKVTVTNSADRPIQVGSHYHFGETNPYLRFDRAKAYGKRLDIPAGTAVRFEPGESKTVTLVPIAGAAVIKGGNKWGNGPVNADNQETFMAAIAVENVQHQEEG